MKFLFYVAVCLGSFVLFMQLFKGPAEDRFFAQFNRQAEASRPYSTQSPATKPAPAPEMIESTPDVSAAAPEMAKATTAEVAAAAPETAAAPPEMATATPDVTAAQSETTAFALEVAAAPPEMATATPEVAATALDTTSAPVVADQPKTQLVPKVGTNARAEAAPKKKRVARKHSQDNDPRNPIWWLWGLSDVR